MGLPEDQTISRGRVRIVPRNSNNGDFVQRAAGQMDATIFDRVGSEQSAGEVVHALRLILGYPMLHPARLIAGTGLAGLRAAHGISNGGAGSENTATQHAADIYVNQDVSYVRSRIPNLPCQNNVNGAAVCGVCKVAARNTDAALNPSVILKLGSALNFCFVTVPL